MRLFELMTAKLGRLKNIILYSNEESDIKFLFEILFRERERDRARGSDRKWEKSYETHIKQIFFKNMLCGGQFA